jgi:hypothetical protein
LSFDGPGCLQRWLTRSESGASPDESVCRERLDNDSVLSVASYIDSVAEAFNNIDMLDLNDLVCPDGYCAARNGQGLVVYRDQQHLTDSFVRAQVPVVRKRLKNLGVGF